VCEHKHAFARANANLNLLFQILSVERFTSEYFISWVICRALISKKKNSKYGKLINNLKHGPWLGDAIRAFNIDRKGFLIDLIIRTIIPLHSA
jgi:hypothetical protein